MTNIYLTWIQCWRKHALRQGCQTQRGWRATLPPLQVPGAKSALVGPRSAECWQHCGQSPTSAARPPAAVLMATLLVVASTPMQAGALATQAAPWVKTPPPGSWSRGRAAASWGTDRPHSVLFRGSVTRERSLSVLQAWLPDAHLLSGLGQLHQHLKQKLLHRGQIWGSGYGGKTSHRGKQHPRENWALETWVVTWVPKATGHIPGRARAPAVPQASPALVPRSRALGGGGATHSSSQRSGESLGARATPVAPEPQPTQSQVFGTATAHRPGQGYSPRGASCCCRKPHHHRRGQVKVWGLCGPDQWVGLSVQAVWCHVIRSVRCREGGCLRAQDGGNDETWYVPPQCPSCAFATAIFWTEVYWARVVSLQPKQTLS